MAAIFDHLFSNTDIEIFESYSGYGQELKRFRATEELMAGLPIGFDKYGNSFANNLAIWSPSVMAEPHIRRINLNKEIEGHIIGFVLKAKD